MQVKLTTSHCIIRQFVRSVQYSNYLSFQLIQVKLTSSHCITRQFVGNIQYSNYLSFQLIQGKAHYIALYCKTVCW